jgi:nucleoside-diphosphate-sugar epimerase
MNAPARPSVLILGANGRFGCAAANAFAAAGWTVLAQVRRDPLTLLPAAATVVRAALEDTAALASSGGSAGIDVVVHAINPIYTRWDAEALPSLEAGLALAERAGALFMFPGNVYNYGAAMPPVLHESTPQRPTTRKGEIRVRMEARIAEAARAGGFPSCVVRAGDFYGAGSGNWFDQAIVRSLASGKLVYPGPLDRPHAWAYLPDLGRAFVRVAEQAHPATFATWHFAGNTLTGAELLDAVDAVATGLGLAPRGGFRRGGLPWGLIRAIGLVKPMWRELARMAYLWQVPHALDGRALDALPGAVAGTPLPTALRESLLALGLGNAKRVVERATIARPAARSSACATPAGSTRPAGPASRRT